MIQPAQRLELVAEYYFAGKLREIAQMQRDGKPVLNLGIGSPDFPPHPSVTAALQNTAGDPGAHGYQSYTGIPALREAWAAWYRQYYDVILDPGSEILPLIGSKEGIVTLNLAYLDRGDAAIILDIAYPAYEGGILLAGADVIRIPVSGLRNQDSLFPAFVRCLSGSPSSTRDTLATPTL